jgi:SAM-dependent methyltransferase
MTQHDDMLRSASKLHRGALRLARRLPVATQSRLRHADRRRAFYRYLEQRVGPGFRPVDPRPAAPAELVAHTSAMTERDVPIKANPDEYFAGGYEGTLYFLQILEKCAFNLRTAGAVLDFGCGTAKNARLFRCIDGLRVVGTDVNPKVVEWARANIPGVELHVNGMEPPLAFEDDSFDLITAASVFTHIPLELQIPWLLELRRILRPNGYFLCTLAGAHHARIQLTGEQRQTLATEGHFTLSAVDRGVSLASQNTGQPDVFQTRAEALSVFKRVLTVVDYLTPAAGQEILVLRKDFVASSASEPTQPSVAPIGQLVVDEAAAQSN